MNNVIKFPSPKWTTERVLSEARRQTKELHHPRSIQAMLAKLVEQAKWTEEELIDALCADVIRRGRTPRSSPRSR